MSTARQGSGRVRLAPVEARVALAAMLFAASLGPAANGSAALIAAAPSAVRTVRTAHFAITHPATVDIAGLAGALEAGYRTVREYGLRLPGSIAVTVHATTQEFAARSGATRMHLAGVRGATLHLQPIGVLRRQAGLDRALAHELVHVALAAGAASMPRWLGEGIAMTVAGELHPAEGRFDGAADLDRALEAPGSREQARHAYATAARLVRALDARIGHARMLAALRAIAGGRPAAGVFQRVAALDLDRWVTLELARASPASTGTRR